MLHNLPRARSLLQSLGFSNNLWPVVSSVSVCAVVAPMIAGVDLASRDRPAGERRTNQALHHVMDNPSGAHTRPATTVKTISCEPLPHVPGKAITTAVVSFPPNAFTVAHRHPGSVTAFVIKGAVRSQLEGGHAITYSAGETWFEPPGVLHLFAENASVTEPAELLTVFIAAENCGPLVIPEQ